MVSAVAKGASTVPKVKPRNRAGGRGSVLGSRLGVSSGNPAAIGGTSYGGAQTELHRKRSSVCRREVEYAPRDRARRFTITKESVLEAAQKACKSNLE